MVDAISSATRTDPNQDLDSDRTTQPATRVVVPPPPPPDLPDVTAFIQNAVRAATGRLAAPSPAPHPMLAMGVRVEDVDTRVLTPMQSNIDAFMDRATPTFHTPDGQDVAVAIPFRMVTPPEVMADASPAAMPYVQMEQRAQANADELRAVARGLGMNEAQFRDLRSGRGSPEDIRRVTQALIQAGKLPPGSPSDNWGRIRAMMCNYGVGLDCAGFVQQAFLASRGTTRAAAGLKSANEENLSGLASRGFRRVALADAKAGDLFILKPPAHQRIGHTMIIRDVRTAEPSDAEALAKLNPSWGHPDASTIQCFDVCSSWGNGANPQAGGVREQLLWHDTVSDKWMHQVGASWKVEDTPYFAHPIEGVYRPSGEH
jgi:hypothetical protein